MLYIVYIYKYRDLGINRKAVTSCIQTYCQRHAIFHRILPTLLSFWSCLKDDFEMPSMELIQVLYRTRRQHWDTSMIPLQACDMVFVVHHRVLDYGIFCSLWVNIIFSHFIGARLIQPREISTSWSGAMNVRMFENGKGREKIMEIFIGYWRV